MTPSLTRRKIELPISAVEWSIVDLSLTEVDQVGVEEDTHDHQDDQQTQLLVRLLESVEERLETREVSDQLENPIKYCSA